jgi:hypothetical protein
MTRMARVVSEAEAREWLDHPLTHCLSQILHHRVDRIVSEILSPRPVDPMRQGQGAAHQWLCRLLDLPPDKLIEELRKENQ